jgi:hypothetical protein
VFLFQRHAWEMPFPLISTSFGFHGSSEYQRNGKGCAYDLIGSIPENGR